MGWANTIQITTKGTTFAHDVSKRLRTRLRRSNQATATFKLDQRALEAERDALEKALQQRTVQLQEIELTRNLELQKFAEFGRLSANLIHEIANPLTAASVSLEAVGDFDNPFIKRAQQNLRHLERYMQAARQQLQDHSAVVDFSMKHEIERVKLVINPLAAASKIDVLYDIERSIILHGDPIKFNQVIANLVVNAIDAYDNVSSDQFGNRISVEAAQCASNITLMVRDWGCGIEEDQLEHIFEPFFTTKQRQQNRGLGIGLAMVKQIVEKDFAGTIVATSSPLNGTIFTLTFPVLQ